MKPQTTKYPAHIRKDSSSKIQYVEEHCQDAAIGAKSKAASEIENAVHLAALLHDLGKYTPQFKAYMEEIASGGNPPRGSVNHTFAGVRFVMEKWHKKAEPSFENLTAELLAYAIGAHHGQFDCINPEGDNGYSYRMEKEGISYSEAKQQFLLQCTRETELDTAFSQAATEVTAIFRRCEGLANSVDEANFYLALFARWLLSVVIDADRTDTAMFMQGKKPNPPLDISKIWKQEFEHIDQAANKMPLDSAVDYVRREVSEQCCNAAKSSNGIFRLAVPTGGGKTLTSLRYAITMANKYQKKRIFFVIPLLTILEQNADVIRETIKNPEIILEHHSNLVREEQNGEDSDEREALLETWDSPIVITTLVQLLNTLFSGKTSCIRRMNALADSVIIIDEVQSVPRKLLSLFNLALNFLSQVCGANIVLCSATQPCLEVVDHPVKYAPTADLVKLTPEMQSVFRRTEIIDKRRANGYTSQELSDFAIACMESEGEALLICNTKAQARGIFTLANRSGAKTFHLSTSMCMAHRRQTLEQIQDCLKRKERFVCISTQLVEAGVDFSFGCVIRISAGLDNVVQAAGRCNRNAESKEARPVYIVNAQDENLNFLPEIKMSQQAAESVLLQYGKSPQGFQNDLSSELAISAYYRRLYTDLPKNSLDYYSKRYGQTLYSMLSNNNGFAKNCPSRSQYVMKQAFKTAGNEFTVFEDNTQDVLVPYGDGKDLVAELAGNKSLHDLWQKKHLLQKAKPYSISLYEFEMKKLRELGGIYSICDDSILVLQSEFYSQEQGFFINGGLETFLEV